MSGAHAGTAPTPVRPRWAVREARSATTRTRAERPRYRPNRLSALAAPLLALDEVHDHGHAVEAEPRPQPVLEEVRVLARHARAVVDLDREARRALADLGGVDELEPVALLHGRLARL